MKKMITLAALALMIGIYAFQKDSKVLVVETEESVEHKATSTRKIASIPSQQHYQMGTVPSDVDSSIQHAEHDAINCLNYDGEDICQSNDESSQENFAEESFVQAEEAQAVIEEPQMDLEEPTTVDYERENTDNALFAATPIRED